MLDTDNHILLDDQKQILLAQNAELPICQGAGSAGGSD
jgi:hypothetical protein